MLHNNSTPRYLHKENENYVYITTCMQIFIAVLLIIAKSWKYLHFHQLANDKICILAVYCVP